MSSLPSVPTATQKRAETNKMILERESKLKEDLIAYVCEGLEVPYYTTCLRVYFNEKIENSYLLKDISDDTIKSWLSFLTVEPNNYKVVVKWDFSNVEYLEISW